MDPRDDDSELLKWIREQQQKSDDDDADETVVMGDSAQVKAALARLLDDDESDVIASTVLMGSDVAQAMLEDDESGLSEEGATVVMTGASAQRFLQDLDDEDTDLTDPGAEEGELSWGDRQHSQPTLAPPAHLGGPAGPAPADEWDTPAPIEPRRHATPPGAMQPAPPELPVEDGPQLGLVAAAIVLMAGVIAVLLSLIGVLVFT